MSTKKGKATVIQLASASFPGKIEGTKKAKPTCGYCLRGTEELVKIECTPDGGHTWIYPILACAPCRAFLRGVYRIHKEKPSKKRLIGHLVMEGGYCPKCGSHIGVRLRSEKEIRAEFTNVLKSEGEKRKEAIARIEDEYWEVVSPAMTKHDEELRKLRKVQMRMPNDKSEEKVK